jgi:hypothetical protein
VGSLRLPLGDSPCPPAPGRPPEVLQLLPLLLVLLAQRFDLLQAVDELSFSIADHLLQPFNIICTAIQHILHVSKQLLFVFYYFPKLCGEDISATKGNY